MLIPWKNSYDQPRQHIKKQRHYFVNKGPSGQAMAFPVVMYGCESWTIKKAECQRNDAFELWCWRRLLRDCNPKGNQPWLFTGRTDADADAEAPILSAPDVKSQLTGKDWWDWRQGKEATQDKMVGWHHQLNGHEFEQTPGDGEGQRSLVCCSSWG